MKEVERENIEKEHLTSLEVVLDILVSTMEEMMQNIIMRDEFVVQNTMSHLFQKNKRLLALTILLLILVTVNQKINFLCIHLWIVMKMDL